MKIPFHLNLKLLTALVILAGISMSYQNCGQVNFTSAPAAISPTSPTNAAAGPLPSTDAPGGPGTTTTIRKFKPALAVRDISCLACHANIQANVVTDFGFGSPWYLNQGGDQVSYGQDHYLPVTWQSLVEIRGQVIVPDASVPLATINAALPAGINPPISQINLIDYLTMSNIIDFSDYWTYQFWKSASPSNLSLTNKVIAPAGMSPVSAQKFVYIGAPTAQELLDLVVNSTAAPWLQVVTVPGGAAVAPPAGFSVVQGVNGSSYISNSGPVQCSGKDVVINGTLLLNNLQIYAEQGGCRLYVTGSVFIEGPITYLNSGATVDATNNLQITSSTSIILGVGISGGASVTPLKARLLDDVRNNLLLRSAPSKQTYNAMATAILNEGLNIGSTLLPDASFPGTLPVGKSANGQNRAKIDFQHLLLNAPLIHSRYLGTVTGVIVAESAMFSLGEFSFNYDPVFQNVPVLPALPQDILCAGSSSTDCNPTQP